MNIFSFLSLISFLIYLYLGIYVFLADVRSKVNRIFMYLYFCWAIWAFPYIFLYTAPSIDNTWIWFRISSLGWCFAPAFLVHFIFIFTKKRENFSNNTVIFLFYTIAFVIYYKAITSFVTVKDFVLVNGIWFPIENTGTIWYYFFLIFYIISAIVTNVLMWKWGRKSGKVRHKRQAIIFVITSISSIILGTISNLILPMLKIYIIPSSTHIFAMIWAIGILYSVLKYKMMTINAEIAANEIIEKMRDLLILTDFDGIIIKTNYRVEELLGYKDEEIYGKQSDFIFENNVEIIKRIKEAGDNRKENNTKEDFEVNYISSKGDKIPVQVSISKIRNGVNEVIGYAIVAHDLRQMKQLEREIFEKTSIESELRKAHNELELKVKDRTLELQQTNQKLQDEIINRKKIQEELQKSEERYRTITNSANDGIVTINSQGIVTFASPKIYELSGYEEKDVIGRYFISFIPDKYIEDTKYYYEKAFSGKNVPIYEVEIIISNKNTIPIEVNLSSYKGIDGRIDGVIGILRDIQDRKKAEAKIREMMNELADLNQRLEMKVEDTVAELREKDKILIVQSRSAAMGEMIANIAHQWRQPLTVIALVLQELEEEYKEGSLTAEYFNDQIREIIKLIKFMSQTINDFKDFFKLDKELEEFDALRVINRTISLVGANFKNNIKIEILCEEEFTIKGFLNEYVQVLLIILNNAKDVFESNAIKNPKIIITASKKNQKSIVTIRDNGGGIPEQIKDKIFKPYFTTKGEDQGTGIGLYMSKNIIEKNMGGKLSFENVEGGVEFRIEV